MPDVNVLVYAHREDEAVHAAARKWSRRPSTAASPFALSALVAVGFVRIVTNPGSTPSHPRLRGARSRRCDAARPNCRLILPGSRHWQLVGHLCRETHAAGSWSRMRSMPPWRSSTAASGSPGTPTSDASSAPDCAGSIWTCRDTAQTGARTARAEEARLGVPLRSVRSGHPAGSLRARRRELLPLLRQRGRGVRSRTVKGDPALAFSVQ